MVPDPTLGSHDCRRCQIITGSATLRALPNESEFTMDRVEDPILLAESVFADLYCRAAVVGTAMNQLLQPCQRDHRER
jgi:hypothetical protein